MKLTIKDKDLTSNGNAFELKAELTQGAVLTLQTALHLYRQQSAIADDLYGFLVRAMEKTGITPHSFD